MERLASDSYGIALSNLESGLNEAESKEEESKVLLLKSTLHKDRIEHIKQRVETGMHIDDVDLQLIDVLPLT